VARRHRQGPATVSQKGPPAAFMRLRAPFLFP
jgi:hypothetical protein